MCSFSITGIADHVASAVSRVVPPMSVAGARANKAINWIGRNISSPQNRLILGATALMSQPYIDLHNRKVDEDTRKVSAARTVAKIIAGTTTGFLVRYGCIKAIDYCSLVPAKLSKTVKNQWLRTLFTPDSALTGVLEDLNQYKKALGSIVALFVMLITNFAIDAPLTKFLTNKFVDKYNLNKNSKDNQPPTSPVIFPLVAKKSKTENKEVKRE